MPINKETSGKEVSLGQKMTNNTATIPQDELSLNYFLWEECLIPTEVFEQTKQKYRRQQYEQAVDDPFSVLKEVNGND